MENHELIRKYLHSEMSDAEQRDFDRRMMEDTQFRDEVEVQTVYYGQRAARLKTELVAIRPSDKAKLPRWIVVVVSLLVIGLIGLGIGLLTSADPQPRDVQLYAMELLSSKHEPPSKLMSESTQDAIWLEAITAYEQGEFAQAITLFETASDLAINEDEARFYKALSTYYATPSDTAEPSRVLLEIAQSSGLYREEARWYLALIYLSRDRQDKAIDLLQGIVNDQGWKHEEAGELLSSIDDPQ